VVSSLLLLLQVLVEVVVCGEGEGGGEAGHGQRCPIHEDETWDQAGEGEENQGLEQP